MKVCQNRRGYGSRKERGMKKTDIKKVKDKKQE